MTVNYSLRQQAQADLESIWLSSYQEWGADQADRYIPSVLLRFTWLSENPQLAEQRADIKPGYHCFPGGMHLISYKITRDEIDIIGIPHQNMDIVGHFDVWASVAQFDNVLPDT